MPHIYAESEEAGFFGVGYAQAEDRLQLVLRHQRAVSGTLAEAFGADHVRSDQMARLWRHAAEAAAAFERLSAQVQRDYRALTHGFNRYMAEHPDQVPGWAPRLEPWLPLAVHRHFLWLPYMAGDAVAACERAGVEPFTGIGLQGPPPGVASGASNAWVLMPWRTERGAAILLSDPHGDIEGFQMFEFAIEAGPWKSMGVVPAGCAFPVLGHTRHVAWGMTTGAPSIADCYRIEIDPADPHRYRYDGGWKAMSVSEEVIAVEGSEPVRVVFNYSDHNGVICPVIARHEGFAYVASSPYQHVAELQDEQLRDWNLARGIPEFRDAMRSCGQFAQNIMAADADGHAWYVRAGRVPIRPPEVDWRIPLDGSSSATAWRGIHPLADLVQAEDPASGYMQNCNISPDTMGAGIDPAEYADYIFNDRLGRSNSRGRRSRELLGRCFQAGVSEALAIALDVTWPDTERCQAELRAALDADLAWALFRPEAVRRFLQRLLEFDGKAEPESPGALAYHHWRVASEGQDPLGAVEAAIAEMVERYGRTDLAYGDAFRVGTGGRSFPGRGGAVTRYAPPEATARIEKVWDRMERVEAPLRLMIWGPPDDQGQAWALSGGRSLRLTVLSRPVESYSVVLHGQSGDPTSPHHSDQSRLVSEGAARRVHFERAELLPFVVSEKQLEPPDIG